MELEKTLGVTAKRPVSRTKDGQYDGEWKPGAHKVRHGRAIELTDEGNTFEGYYVNDKKCGKGRIITVSGEVFEGQMKDGKMHGFGK